MSGSLLSVSFSSSVTVVIFFASVALILSESFAAEVSTLQKIKPKIDKKYSQSSHKQPPREFREVVTTIELVVNRLCDETIEGGCLRELLA